MLQKTFLKTYSAKIRPFLSRDDAETIIIFYIPFVQALWAVFVHQSRSINKDY